MLILFQLFLVSSAAGAGGRLDLDEVTQAQNQRDHGEGKNQGNHFPRRAPPLRSR